MVETTKGGKCPMQKYRNGGKCHGGAPHEYMWCASVALTTVCHPSSCSATTRVLVYSLHNIFLDRPQRISVKPKDERCARKGTRTPTKWILYVSHCSLSL